MSPVKALTVADIMSTEVLTLPPNGTVGEAARLMLARGVGSVVIVDRQHLVGILTERDLVRFTASGGDPSTTSVVEVMTPDPDTIQPSEEVTDVFRRFAARNYRHVPVVDRLSQELVGIVSMRDLIMKLQRGPPVGLNGAPLPTPVAREVTQLTVLSVLETGQAGNVAIVAPDGPELKYSSLRTAVQQVADVLAELGIARSDRVAIVLPQGPAAIVATLGTTLAATAAPLNPAFTRDEFQFFYDDVAARAVILPEEGIPAARDAWNNRGPTIELALTATGEPRLSLSGGPRSGRTSGRTVQAPGPDDVALILHSSGTTGRPKRAPLRHRNLVASTDNIVSTYGLDPTDVALCVMPLFHVHGLVASVLATLASGGTVVVPPRFNPLSFRRLLQAHSVSWYTAVPSIHQLITARASEPLPSGNRLRFARSASAALAESTLLQIEASLGVPMLEAYGMTEGSHQVASNLLPPAPREVGSVGRGIGVRIGVMNEEGSLLTVGASGEVVIQGPNVIDGYDNNPDANAAAFTHGWFRTGDLGVLDAAGYLTLVGRLKEMINRAGEKIAPAEVDETLLKHPAVAEAVSFGAPHPTWGEEVQAVVVLRADVSEKELLQHCQEHLAEFKIPRKLYVVDAIPRGATGKVQRNRMRDLLGLP